MSPSNPAPINRELSQLAFNRRVLSLAQDSVVPVLERLRFLCIVGSNLDEFFEIRVAGLKQQLLAHAPPPGMTLPGLRALLAEVGEEAHRLVDEQYRVLNEEVLPALAHAGIRLMRRADLNPVQRAWMADYFHREVKPLLTPIGLDPAHPFPLVVNKSLNFVIELSGRDAFGRETSVAILKAPRLLPRIIALPNDVAGAPNTFVLLSSVIHEHAHEMFEGRDIVAYSQFRVTRDADLWFDEEEVKNLRQALEGELPQRQFGLAVRLEVAANCPPHLAQLLLKQFELAEADLYAVNGPVNLARMSALVDAVDAESLKYRPFRPSLPDRLKDSTDILATIRHHDVLLHHPFQSFEPVIEFIRRAVDDPDVVAIKQTVYRTGANSVLMEALIDAAHQGKEVTVVVELLARFDEEANINWAERLEQAGAQVVYGVFGLKTHAKLALLLRREKDAAGNTRLQPYAHLGTGNYHGRTARLYTDFGLLTSRADICADINEVFLHITSLARATQAAPPVARALHDARAAARRDPARGEACARGQARAHRREDERAARGRRDPGALRGVAGGRADRPHRSRRLRAATRPEGTLGEHPRALDRRPLPRAQPDLVFSERRPRIGVVDERGLDGAQPLSPDRGRVPGARSGAQGAGDQGRARAVPRRQPERMGARRRWRLSPRQR